MSNSDLVLNYFCHIVQYWLEREIVLSAVLLRQFDVTTICHVEIYILVFKHTKEKLKKIYAIWGNA